MLINKHYDQLNENDLSTLQYIINHKQECCELSITQLATKCTISKSSILRTAQKLGFSGFSEFKYALKDDKQPETDKSVNYFQQTVKNVINTINFFKKSNITPIYEKIGSADHIYAYGTGYAQRNAISEMKRNFLNCGVMINNIDAKRELDMATNWCSDRDLLIVVALSGEVSDILEDIRLLRMKQVPILSLTDANFNYNELASLVPYNLYYNTTSYPINNMDQIKDNPISLITLSLLCEALCFGYMSYNQKKDI
jgi:Transcriptional regulators